ncbi:uncharacterized protein LOC131628547 [Vicia villosa]|uniref:uncharacterized protein LOC131628547 n=1 Tax=Vicia villosa TaxID=3911 RepID=UPI00273CE72F|nr:uncharacterized protein LOC131628547 [Vicia villosa]
MVGCSSRGSTLDSASSYGLPKCGCGREMKMWVANIVQNPNRKFWKCRSAGTENSCELFPWDDEIGDFNKGETVIHSLCKKCDVLELQLESLTSKLKKLKMKFEAQKRNNMQLKIAFVLCCLVVGLFYNFM